MSTTLTMCLGCGRTVRDVPRGRWVVVGLKGFDAVVREWQPTHTDPRNRPRMPQERLPDPWAASGMGDGSIGPQRGS